jgi:hypothetical protein
VNKTRAHELASAVQKKRFSDSFGSVPAFSPVKIRLDQVFDVSDAVSAELAANARRFTSGSPTFTKADFSALVERLAASIAYFSMTGFLTMDDIAGGRDIHLVAASTWVPDRIASSNCVWFPRLLDSVTAPNVVSALAAACCGVECTPITDLVSVDADRRTLVPESCDRDLAEGAHKALAILAANMAQSDAGALFTYAFTKGIHSVATVVGMTDEAGIVRDALRAVSFQPSFGGISQAIAGYNGLPIPNGDTVRSWASFVDGIALTTAAVAALADPLVSFNGRLYPTFYSSTAQPRGTSGVDVGTSHTCTEDIANKVASGCGDFCTNYVKLLTKLFSLSEGSYVDKAARHMIFSFSEACVSTNRHLAFPSVAPYFWIEPTGIVDFDASEYPAVREGYAHLCTPTADKTMPLFPECQYYDTSGDFGELNCVWRSARNIGAVIHLNNHKRDGLANVKFTMADPENFIHVGGPSKSVRERMTHGDDVASYLWSRGDVALPAPSECMYVGVGVGLTARHTITDRALWQSDHTHFPSPSECEGNITISVSRLYPLDVGGLGPDRHAVRSFTFALAALDAARWAGRTKYGRVIGTVSFYDALRTPLGYPPHIGVPTPAGLPPPHSRITQREAGGAGVLREPVPTPTTLAPSNTLSVYEKVRTQHDAPRVTAADINVRTTETPISGPATDIAVHTAPETGGAQ